MIDLRSNYRGLCVVAAALSLLTMPLTGCKGTFNNQIDTAQEIKIGQQAADEVEKDNKIDDDINDNTRIQRIAQPIFVQARKMRNDVNYQIKIIDGKDVNAFSLPGGWIYIYTGLIEKAGNDDDALACVIGHETAHVVRRHAAKQISDAESKGVLVDILGILSRSDAAYQSASMVYELDQLHYSRQDEYEADRYGLMFAYNAGYDPYGMPRFFAVLQKLEQKGENSLPWANDHPITRNRIARVNQLIEELRANHGVYPDEQVAPKS